MTDQRFSGIGMTSARTRDRLVQRLRDQGIKNVEVLDQVRNIPRHIFVDEALSSRAYEDTALPIGFGQTISQPYIVAKMTESLFEGGPLQNVLEVGTGCGYQTAILAGLVGKIATIERLEPLVKRAKERLKELGIKNVKFRHGDGTFIVHRVPGPSRLPVAGGAHRSVPRRVRVRRRNVGVPGTGRARRPARRPLASHAATSEMNGAFSC